MANTTDDTSKNLSDEDNFGLPDIEYKPLDQLEEAKSAEEPAQETSEPSDEPLRSQTYSDESPVYEEEEESSSSAPKIIGVLIVLVVLIAGVLIYQFVYKPKQEAKAKQEKIDKDKAEADKKAEEERQAKLAEEERLKREAAAANAKPAEGTIETLSERSGHYYVIIASSIDGDLVMDQAKKLSAKGVGSKIIPPFGKWKFYRLGIGNFDSFSNAQSSADASKGEYGSALWVMKY